MRPDPFSLFKVTEREQANMDALDAALQFLLVNNATTFSAKLAEALANRVFELMGGEVCGGRMDSIYNMHLHHVYETALVIARTHAQLVAMPDDLRHVWVGPAPSA